MEPLVITVCNSKEKNKMIQNLLSAHHRVSRKVTINEIPLLIAQTSELMNLIDNVRNPQGQLISEEKRDWGQGPPK